MSEIIGSTNGGGAKGGNGGGNPEVITCIVEQPRSGTQVIVDQPFQVSGSSSSDQGKIASVAVFVDRTTLVKAVNDSGDWGSWHASIVVSTAVAHAIHAEATSAKNNIGRSTELYVAAIVDTPALSLVSPAPSAPGVITPNDLSFTLAIHAKTVATNISKVQYQLSGGTWGDLGTFPPATDVNVQGRISLPGGPVPQHGESYPLKVQSIPPGNELDFTVSIVDVARPVVTFVPEDGARVPSGNPLVVTVQASDPGPIASGVATVSVQLDNLPAVFATQPPGGDPSTWSALLPDFIHDKPQITVVVNDVAGNSTTVQHLVVVGLTSWTRLEPMPRDPTLMEGLQARVADPLWLLARQAAFGEFTGQDAASPVSVRLRARSSSLTRMRPARATGPGVLLPRDGGPLEVLTEAEPEPGLHTAPRPLFAAQAGLHYFRLLGRTAGIGDWTGYRNGLLTTYPIAAVLTVPVPGVPPSATTADPLLQPYIGRVPDGERLYGDLASTVRAGGGLPANPPLAGANAAAVVATAHTWLTWYDAVTGQALGNRDTWDPGRLEYAFSIASPGPDAETVFEAAEYDTGSLDWFDFDLLASSLEPAAPGVSLGAVVGDLPPQIGPPPPPPLARGESQIKFVGLPSPVAFRGMPNRRWWDFEDAAIDFGSLTAPVEDITTSLVVEFAMQYGNDHFMIPVPLEVGSVCRVDSLVVTDTYGEVLRIKPISDFAGPFRLFEHTLATSSSRDPLFVLFPTLGETITGSPIEEVHYLRDEAAEIVWAIEQTVLGPAGLPVDRTQDALAHFHTPPPTPNDGSTLPVRKYVLRTDVEQNWFPFLLPDATGTELTMAIVPPLDPSGTVPAPLPWGRILAPYAPISGRPGATLPQEEVTRAGVQVARAWKYARWIDGRQLSWVGRRVRPGRGPGASGVSYDLVL